MRSALLDVPGVREANVSLKQGQARVLANSSVTRGALVSAVEEAGFTAQVVSSS